MIRTTLAALTVAMTAGSVLAQAPAPVPPPAGAPAAARPPQQTRARAPELALAVEIAQAAEASCRAGGFRTAVLVTDAAGVPVAQLLGDGAGARLAQIAPTKAAMVLKYKVASSVTTTKAATDAALAAEIRADPAIGQARAGAIPIMVGADMIGTVAVAGAPSGAADEACAVQAVAKVQSRLK